MFIQRAARDATDESRMAAMRMRQGLCQGVEWGGAGRAGRNLRAFVVALSAGMLRKLMLTSKNV